jgi:DNA-binding response OmpR family regulator
MTKKKILVVDDEQTICLQFSKALTGAGYAVRTADSAEAALKLMTATPADLLYLDLNLPGMNGMELGRQIRKHWPWAITIAVTGYASVFQLVDCREAGFDDYFIKPLNLDDLLGTADHAFKKIQRWRAR